MSKTIIALYVMATAAGLILLKLGSSAGSPLSFVESKLSLNVNPVVLTGVALYALSFILYTYLISKFDLGYIIPLTTGLVYVLIFVASFFIFKETFTFVKVAAIGMIFAGVILLNVK